MSSHVHIPVLVTSRPPSREDLDLERRCPASASDSGSESADSPPPDSPQDRGRAALPPLDLKLANRQHVAGPYSSSTSSYSPSPTSSESAHQSAYDRPIQPLVQTVPVIPTLLPMPSLATEPSLSPTLSDAGTTKARSGEEHRCLSTQTEGQVGPSRTRSKHSSATIGLASTLDQTAPYNSSHPYARIYTRKEGAKRRKMWNHAFEKSLFTPQEISTMGAPQRRTIYTASLEAHIDKLHAQLLSYALFPVPFEKLDCFRGLNTKTAKSMVAGLHRDANELRMKRLELDRAMHDLRNQLYAAPPTAATYAHSHMHSTAIGMRRHSLD